MQLKLCAEWGGDENGLSSLGAHDGTDEVKAQSVAGAFVGASERFKEDGLGSVVESASVIAHDEDMVVPNLDGERLGVGVF